MLGCALEWLRADVNADMGVITRLLAPDASMFGASGAEEVLALKRRLLAVGEGSAPLYAIDAVHEVDTASRTVVAAFECLMPGKAGTGTEVLTFDGSFRVVGAAAVRHGAGS